jgi:DNA-binding CsgD family transcriptional regulator
MKSVNDYISISGKNQSENIDNGLFSKAISDSQALGHEFPENDYRSFFDYCLIDHSGKQFACVHYGHCHEQSNCFINGLLKDNLKFHKLLCHPEDRLLWCEEAFPDILKFIDSEPTVKFPDYRFIFNHRYIRNDGSISQFMHEGSITFPDDKLLPVLNLKVFFEIADIKTDDSIVLTIFRYTQVDGYQKVFTREYGKYSNSLLSHREIEIIRLCHEGLSSKMIAERLNLSIHTVKNHKRHCMEKTSTHNINELIHVCIQKHWL